MSGLRGRYDLRLFSVVAFLMATPVVTMGLRHLSLQVGDPAQSITAELSAVPLPALSKVRELEHSFGRVRSRFAGSCQFKILNDSTSTWTVKRVQSGCSCTVAEIDQPSIQPGKSATISVEYRGGSESVDDRQTVTLEFDESAAPLFKLHILVNIRKPLTVLPKEIDLKVLVGDPAPHVKLTALMYFPSKLPLRATASVPWINCSVVPVPIPQSQSHDPLRPFHAYQVDVSLQVSTDRPATMNAELLLTNSDLEEAVRIPVRFSMAPLVRSLPDRVAFADCKPGQEYRRSVQLVFANAKSRKQFGVPQVASDLNGDFAVSAKDVSPTVTRLDITFRPSEILRQHVVRGIVTVNFADSDYSLKIAVDAGIAASQEGDS